MQNHLRFAKILARFLDNQFKIGKFSFGLDPILGLIPGVGDFISLLFSLYIIWIGFVLGINQRDKRRMIGNVLIDAVFSSVPLVGDTADFFYKANIKNMEILKKYEQNIVDAETVEKSN